MSIHRIFYAAGTVYALAAVADAISSEGFSAWERGIKATVDAVSGAMCTHMSEETLVAAASATDTWSAVTGARHSWFSEYLVCRAGTN